METTRRSAPRAAFAARYACSGMKNTTYYVNFIIVADIQSAYWQIPVHPDHVETTAFATDSGKYCYKRVAFGVYNAADRGSRLMAGANWQL